MPRSLRVDYAGAWHHVMNRGADRRDIFEDGADRRIFLDALALAAKRFHLEVHAYCLMSNHFHLLLLSCEGRLSAGMKFISGRFTRLANVRAGRDGPLFRGRYYSVGITSDAHLVEACRYIHLNPVAARMTQSAEAWHWSSARAYIGRGVVPHWLKTEHVLDLFGPSERDAKYRDFLGDGVDIATAKFYAELGW